MKFFRTLKKGFTLVELVVVIAIIAILSGVSVAVYVGITNNAKESKYLQLATQGMKQLLTEYGGSLEENTYFSVKDNGEEVAFFKYNQGKIAKVASRPTDDVDYMYPTNSTNSTLLEEVTAYRPIVKEVVNKLNSYLTATSVQTYEAIADAGNYLTDQDMGVINYRDSGYKFNYSLADNKAYVKHAAEQYPTGLTGTATAKTLAGANISSAQDLVDFSAITNLCDSTNYYAPITNNIFVKDSPCVILNLKNTISMDSSTVFNPIANWGPVYGALGRCHSIHLLFNGNNNAINNLNNALIGGLDSGSIIRDLKVNYSIGSSDGFVNSNYVCGINDSLGDVFHFGLLAKAINTNTSVFLAKDTIRINNLSLGGKVFMNNTAGKRIQDNGVVFGAIFKKSQTANFASGEPVFNLTNYSLFEDESDYMEIKSSELFALIVGNPYTKNISYTEKYGSYPTVGRPSSINHIYGLKPYNSSLDENKYPYIGAFN